MDFQAREKPSLVMFAVCKKRESIQKTMKLWELQCLLHWMLINILIK